MNIFYRNFLFCLALVLSCNLAEAQQAKQHLIFFNDKGNTPYAVSQPEAFLSARAIQRRQAQNITIKEKDLPVDPVYVNGVREKGAEVIYTTKWLNGAVISCTDSVLQLVLNLPYVVNSDRLTQRSTSNVDREEEGLSEAENTMATQDYDYGSSANQIEMLGVQHMHAQGFEGQGKVVAVLDAGFSNVDQLAAFQHIFTENRFLGAYDFVTNTPDNFGNHTHGTRVLSCLAAFLPGQVIGTAPGASYYLFRTEDAASELKIEEAYWLVAAEKADSLGVDIINSSLGYNHFDDPTMNYTTAQLDGKTAIVTRAAASAAATGMLVVNSAGNEGRSETWEGKIVFPADADSIIAVGAVEGDSTYTDFSSKGPTVDGRIKPDLVAQGVFVAIADVNGNVGTFNGTSFSAPLISGMAAGVWQAFPELTNLELIDVLKRSASQYTNPDNLKGYGIPSFAKIANVSSTRLSTLEGIKLYPTLVNDEQLKLHFSGSWKGGGSKATLMITDMTGRVIRQENLANAIAGMEYSIPISTAQLVKGMYMLRLISEKGQVTFKFVKQ